MTLLAPLFFYVAVGVAAGVVALHFIVTRQPTSSVLPTVRFVPKSTVRVVTFSRPRDLLLLLLRVLTVLLIGLAFAQPVLVPERRPVARIVLADVSRAVGEIEEVRDSALALLGEGDVLVAFDREARVVREEAADTAAVLERSTREGRLSVALVAALRAAPELRAEADSIELAIVSALRADQVDGATQAIREIWPGRIRIVPVAPGADTLAAPAGLGVRAEDEDDGVALAARLAGLVTPAASDSTVRIVRGQATAEDSVWAAGGRRTLVRWPAEGAPPGWRERARPDTAGAVIAGAAALVYPLERRWTPGGGVGASGGREGTSDGVASGKDASGGTVSDLAAADRDAADASPSGTASSSVDRTGALAPEWRVVARWVDGEPAAVERTVGAGCIRDVGIPVPERGDVVFRPSFAHLVRTLGAPCEATAGSVALGEEAIETLAGSGPLAHRDSIGAPELTTAPLVPWLLALALVLALVELWARRGSAASASATSQREEGAPVDRDGDRVDGGAGEGMSKHGRSGASEREAMVTTTGEVS